MTNPNITKTFWKKWRDAPDRAKAIKDIQKYIEQDWKYINSMSESKSEIDHLKARNLNSYFEDLYEALGKRC